MGPESCAEAILKWPNSLRAIYGDHKNPLHNVLYGSDDGESAKQEINFFFPNIVVSQLVVQFVLIFSYYSGVLKL